MASKRRAPVTPVMFRDVSGERRSHLDTRVNQKVKAIFKLRGNRDREELAHCAVLTMPVEQFSYFQYSALPSVEGSNESENMDAPLQYCTMTMHVLIQQQRR